MPVCSMNARVRPSAAIAESSGAQTLQWIISLLFWGQLLLAAVVYGAVALAPKVVTLIALRNDHLVTQAQLVWLEQQVQELQQVTEVLENDPRILQELARIDLDVTRPGETRIPLDSDLMLQSRITEQRPMMPDVTRRWYEPLVSAFAINQQLRRVSLLSAIVLILISFTFFHPSQSAQFSVGLRTIRDSMRSMSGRYRA